MTAYSDNSTFNPFQDGTITYSVNGSGVQFELTVVVELNTAAPAGTTYSGSYNSSYYSLIGLQINGSLTASILLNNRSAGGLGIGGTNYRYYADAPAGWTCSVQDEIVGGVAVRSYVHIYGTDYVSGGHAITAIICPAYTSTLVGGTAQGGLNGTINVVATDLRFNGFWAAKTWATYNNFLSLYKPTTTTIQLPAAPVAR